MKKSLPFILAALFAVVPRPAHAYLDPGTGSMAIQLLVAGVLGALFTIKTWWRTILAYFGKLFGRSTSE